VVWGPLAGYFAARQAVPLTVTPVSPQVDSPSLPFVFDISMGVRRGDTALKAELDRILARRRRAIDTILAEYHVPRVAPSIGRSDVEPASRQKPASHVEPGLQSRRPAIVEPSSFRSDVEPGLQSRRPAIPGVLR
jgi:hypothetical protein